MSDKLFVVLECSRFNPELIGVYDSEFMAERAVEFQVELQKQGLRPSSYRWLISQGSLSESQARMRCTQTIVVSPRNYAYFKQAFE